MADPDTDAPFSKGQYDKLKAAGAKSNADQDAAAKRQFQEDADAQAKRKAEPSKVYGFGWGFKKGGMVKAGSPKHTAQCADSKTINSKCF